MSLLSWLAQRFERRAPPKLADTAAQERDVYARLDAALASLAEVVPPARRNGHARDPELPPGSTW